MIDSTRHVRVTIAVYLLVCIIAMLTPPMIPISDPGRVTYWAASAVICGLVLIATVLPFRAPRAMLVAAGWLLLALALYLHFGLADLLAMLTAMPLSVAVLSLLSGQVAARTRRALVTLHVTMSGIWLGVAVVMVTLTLDAAGTDDIAVAASRYALLEQFDVTILPLSSLGTIMSGLAVSLTGKWGLVRYYWVLVKFVLAVVVLASAFAWIHDDVVHAATLAASGEGVAELPAEGRSLVVSFGYAGTLVLVATILSIYKPWGRTAIGQRALGQPRGGRSAASRATRSTSAGNGSVSRSTGPGAAAR